MTVEGWRPPNDRLADARRRLLSPSGSGRVMSRQELADAVNAYLWTVYRERTSVDRGYVGKLEQGVHRWPRARLREAFRHVLGATGDADLGFFIVRRVASATGAVSRVPDTGEDGDVNRRQVLTGVMVPGISALITAVTVPFAGDARPDLAPVEDLDVVAAELRSVHAAYQHSRYTAAVSALPRLLAALRRLSETAADPQRIAALQGEAFQVASALLLKGDEPVLAAIAAERSTAAAVAADDPLTQASSSRAVVHCLMSSGHPDQAASLAVRAADRVAAAAGTSTPAALSVYGALLLRGAIAAAREENRDQAHALLDEAARAAAHLGTDQNLHWTAFGPTNVTAHRVAVAVELGDAGTAVAHAKTVDLAKLCLPERKAMLLLDTARALTQWGRWARAFDAIRSAEQHAPEEVRARPAVHTMISELAQRAPTPVQQRVREYARHIGVPA